MARPDRQYRTDAIILRRQDFKEYDRLLTLFTPGYGKFTVIAKGARRPTGRMTGHVELFARITMMIARGRDLDVLTQAEMADAFLPIRENLDRAAYANYVVDLLDRFTEQEEQNAALYDLLERTLAYIAVSDCDLRVIGRHYEMELLRLVGFQPELFYCVAGHEPIEAQDQYFSAFDGGAICPEHAENNPHAVPISLNALKTLRYLQSNDFEVVSQLHLGELLHQELERTTQNYVVFLLERRLKSVDFIRRLRRTAD